MPQESITLKQRSVQLHIYTRHIIKINIGVGGTKFAKNSPAKISWDRMRKQFYQLPALLRLHTVHVE